MFIGMLTASVLMPSLVAQRDKFGEIECTSLRVVDENGNTRVAIKNYPSIGYITTFGRNGLPQLMLGASLFSDRGELAEHGGSIVAYGKGGKKQASLGINEQGGYVQVTGESKGQAAMAINEYGNGAVSTWDKNGYRQ